MVVVTSLGVLVSDWQTSVCNIHTDLDQGYKVTRKVAEADG
jgi:hypothetical protein